ncbi:MAG: hypothetical protein ACTSYB_18765 [Candidatus Helarchaeota archaeon]
MTVTDDPLVAQKFRTVIQPLLTQWSEFKNSIYSELQLIYHDLLVKIALKTGKNQLIFKEREIPLFKTVASPTSPNWKIRLKEELEKLEYLRIYCHNQIIFKKIQVDPKNSRIFHCRSEFTFNNKIHQIYFQIRLPLRYPYETPIADNYGFRHFIQPAGDHRNACLGKIKERWNKDGRMGIAHFLVMLSYYTALALFTNSLE